MTGPHRFGWLLVGGILTVAGSAACLGTSPTSAPVLNAKGPGPPAPDLPRISMEYASPASIGDGGWLGGSASAGAGVTRVGNLTGLPPARMLQAYRRASIVLDAADPACHLSWSLVAAVGNIESDHGRVNGSHVSSDGVVHPPIVGPRLDGEGVVGLVLDTDLGRLDGDPEVDRGVGPMQFIPSTWAVVAVDGDGDGLRDPQDIDDAALAAAVYLCAGHDDLATDAGKHAALFRYNRSSSYVDRVLAAMSHYEAASQGFTPSSTPAAGGFAQTVDQQHVVLPVGVGLAGSAWELPAETGWDLATGWAPGTKLVPETWWTPQTWWPLPSPWEWLDWTPTLTSTPTANLTTTPAVTPTPLPTPTATPTAEPTSDPGADPTPEPTAEPTSDPTAEPTSDPTPVATIPDDAGSSTSEPTPAPGAPSRASATPTPPATPSDGASNDPIDVEVVGGAGGSSDPTGEEQAAWLLCVTKLGPVVDPEGEATLIGCLAEALGLPGDDGRLVWIVITQMPAKQPE